MPSLKLRRASFAEATADKIEQYFAIQSKLNPPGADKVKICRF
jgi:hypothetical protein